MSDPYIGEIRILPYTFAPRDWSTCDGQLLPVSQNTALFSVLGTTYGGNGVSNFKLPDMQGRAPIHNGRGAGLSNRPMGETFGSASVTLTQTEMPQHNHTVRVAGVQGDQPTPNQHYLAEAGTKGGRGGQFVPTHMYTGPNNVTGSMASQALKTVGGSQGHPNMQPFLGIQFCICLNGIFPPRQ